MNIWAVLFLLLLASTTVADDQSNVFDVTSSKYGGQPDSDISKALAMAWTDACESTATSTVLVPTGTYELLQQATFEGPCKAPIQFQLQGTLQAPKDRSQLDESWINFRDINGLTMSGGGTFDGQGELSWKQHQGSTPVDINFKTVSNAMISDLTFKDSAKFHIKLHDSDTITFQRVTITAPEDSPNTDGIHIAKSTKITVTDSTIATGDDCVSIGDGSSQILVSNVNCGPGHGISIGSLGKYPDEQPVVGIMVKNCTLTGTTNGARIKTWPDSPGISVVSNVLFQDIIMVNVKNPILINQYYCDKGKTCKLNIPSKVQISDVSFKNIRGSTVSPVAVKLNCSQSSPCRNVELSEIDLTYSGDSDEKITSECSNVQPRIASVSKDLACANLGGDIPPEGDTPPSPPEENTPPSPPEENTPPSPPEENTPPSPPEENTPPSPSEENTPPPPSEENTPPPPSEENTPPSPSEENTPPSPSEENTPPSPPVAGTPPPPKVAPNNQPPATVMIFGNPDGNILGVKLTLVIVIVIAIVIAILVLCLITVIVFVVRKLCLRRNSHLTL